MRRSERVPTSRDKKAVGFGKKKNSPHSANASNRSPKAFVGTELEHLPEKKEKKKRVSPQRKVKTVNAKKAAYISLMKAQAAAVALLKRVQRKAETQIAIQGDALQGKTASLPNNVKNERGGNVMEQTIEQKRAAKKEKAALSFAITYFDWLMNGHIEEASLKPAEDEKPIIELFNSFDNDEDRKKKLEELTTRYYNL